MASAEAIGIEHGLNVDAGVAVAIPCRLAAFAAQGAMDFDLLGASVVAERTGC